MTTKKAVEPEHGFTLVLEGVSALEPETLDAFFVAGCDDATFSVRFGRVLASFDRRAATLKDAILSAVNDVERAGVGAKVARLDQGDLVSQAEIARRIGRTRQMVGLCIAGKRGPGGFPAPACAVSSDAPQWRWGEVAAWLGDNGMIEAEALLDAQDAATLNAMLELRRNQGIAPERTREIIEGLGWKAGPQRANRRVEA